MNIELVGKELHPSDMLKERLETKLTKLEERLGQNLFVRVRLGQESPTQYACAIHFSGGGHEFNAVGTADDLIKAADDSLHKIERQVRKQTHKGDARRNSGSIRTVAEI